MLLDPHGKIVKGDKTAFRVGFDHEHNVVLVEFSQPVTHLRLSADDATMLVSMLVGALDGLEVSKESRQVRRQKARKALVN